MAFCSLLDAKIPLLLGMDLLTNMLKSIIDCGRNVVAFPTVENMFYYAEKLSGNHLAVCLSTRSWWKPVPATFLFDDPAVLTLGLDRDSESWAE